jgi:hypothetical protein
MLINDNVGEKLYMEENILKNRESMEENRKL